MGQAKSKSKPVWNIKQDNWLDKVNNVVKEEGNLDDQTKAFVPIWPSPDPASGCQKEFTSAYQCAPGTSQKEVIIPASADGHTATYDCSQEFIQCARGVLEILDTGEVILRSGDGSEIFWRSGPNKTGLSVKTFSAVKSKYGRNYLQAGETLAVGEWVGSPSGNCYLTVVSDGSTSQLVVAFQEIACNPEGEDPDGLGKDDYITTQGETGAWYVMSQGVANNEYAGKFAYSDTNMHKRNYPDSMIHKSDDFIQLAGNFSQRDGIAKTMAGDFDTCKTECNKMEHCEGLITSKDSSGADTCTLLNSAYPNKGRILDFDGTDTLYVRKAKIDNPPTCSGDVETSYGATFANQIKGLEMTPKTKCSLGQMTAQQMKIVKAAQTKLENAANTVANDLNNLNNQNATLDQNMLNEIAQIQKDTKQFETVQKETQILKKDIVDVSGMEESSGLDMVSNNIQLVMWTALGAIAVIGTIKATK